MTGVFQMSATGRAGRRGLCVTGFRLAHDWCVSDECHWQGWSPWSMCDRLLG